MAHKIFLLLFLHRVKVQSCHFCREPFICKLYWRWFIQFHWHLTCCCCAKQPKRAWRENYFMATVPESFEIVVGALWYWLCIQDAEAAVVHCWRLWLNASLLAERVCLRWPVEHSKLHPKLPLKHGYPDRSVKFTTYQGKFEDRNTFIKFSSVNFHLKLPIAHQTVLVMFGVTNYLSNSPLGLWQELFAWEFHQGLWQYMVGINNCCMHMFCTDYLFIFPTLLAMPHK